MKQRPAWYFTWHGCLVGLSVQLKFLIYVVPGRRILQGADRNCWPNQ